MRVLRGFQRSQGPLLAAAIAYYALLSVVPLLILSVVALSELVEQTVILATLARYLEWLFPSQSTAFLDEVSHFLEHRAAIGAVLLLTMLFFSSLAFSLLEKAMATIFGHRSSAAEKRHFLASALLPYCFVVLLAVCLLALTIASVAIEALADKTVHVLGSDWSLRGLSSELLYLAGLAIEVLIVTAIYRVMPVGRIRLQHAFVGACTAMLLWEVVRRVLTWYLTTLSKASLVYGPLASAVVALFSMEIAATVLLLGAQVIAEYEKLEGDLVSEAEAAHREEEGERACTP